jgi:hypothetical protein
MDTPAIVIIGIYGFGFLIVGILLVYLIFRRRRIKKTEDFEEREN